MRKYDSTFDSSTSKWILVYTLCTVNKKKIMEYIKKNKAKIAESCNNMAAFYAVTDKTKAKELLNKTIALDPTNAYATEALKKL